jgi:hypothetical protein
MSKHTPGPWELGGPCTMDTCGTVVDQNGREVATIDNRNDLDMERANARLIAAAPELLQSCMDALAVIRVSSLATKPGLVDRLSTTIVKATGGA